MSKSKKKNRKHSNLKEDNIKQEAGKKPLFKGKRDFAFLISLLVVVFIISLFGWMYVFGMWKSFPEKLTILYTGDAIGEIEPCG